MGQRFLFDEPAAPPIVAGPTCHANDPATSVKAGHRHDVSGRAAAHARMVLEMVKARPNSTAVELWEGATEFQRFVLCEMQEVRRRLTDLHRAGRVRQGDARHCAVKGSKMVTWFTTE